MRLLTNARLASLALVAAFLKSIRVEERYITPS